MIRIFFLPIATGMAALTIGGATISQASADDEAAAFDENCTTCHIEGDIPQWREQFPNTDDGRERLDTFLQDHHASDADDRALIITYIEKAL
ncbi:hypothetical protein [Fodinicurvata sp. EGI_FJ10296]|uniref:hypothetical protein n=1 Tax=Fodinicurvata sp. EGI_FJ10296 TaxID=3231908 RepID=UPI003452C9C3